MSTPLPMTKISELDTAAPIDITVLNGVYEVHKTEEDNKLLMYTLTFDNGKLTIVDTDAAAEFPLEGNYKYNVPSNDIAVEGDKPEMKAAIIAFAILFVLSAAGFAVSAIYTPKKK